jgi:Virulence factor
MVDVTVVYWRDIPAQVIVGKGRGAAKVPLHERFEQAIDRCAMKIGARDTDSYLAEWRKAAPYAVEGEPVDVARAEAARLESEHDAAQLKQLIDADGWAKAPS